MTEIFSPSHEQNEQEPIEGSELSLFRNIMGARLAMIPVLIAIGVINPTDTAAAPIQDDAAVELDESVGLYELAQKHKSEADLILSDLLNGESLKPKERKIIEGALDYEVESLLSLAIQETHLRPQLGYMQLKGMALDDLNESLPFLNANKDSQKEPSMNIAYGLLYLSMLKNRYLEPDGRFANLDDSEKRRLVHIMYNLGPIATKRAWDSTNSSSMDEFLLDLEFRVEKLKSEGAGPNTPAFPPNKYPSLRKLEVTIKYSYETDLRIVRLKTDPDDYIAAMGLD